MNLESFIEKEEKKPVIISDDQKILEDYKKYNLESSNIIKTKSHKPKTIQDTTVDDVLYEIDCIIDHYIDNKFQYKIPIFKSIFNERIKNTHAKEIKIEIQKHFNEFNELLTTTDEDLLDAYSLSKYEINKLVDIYQSLLELCNDNTGTVKKRKERKKKTKSIDKIISKVKICQSFPELNLKSVDVKNIIGATQVWVYNTKYKKLGCYYSKNQDGFNIKGTTILAFNEGSSIQKIVRKPKELLTSLMSGGSMKLLDELKTTSIKLTGRLNEDIVILKVI